MEVLNTDLIEKPLEHNFALSAFLNNREILWRKFYVLCSFTFYIF